MIDSHQILPNISIGGAPPEGYFVSNAGFDILILCAMERQPKNFSNVDVYNIELSDDGINLLTFDQKHDALVLADKLANEIRSGKNTLFTCVMGLNRSSLIAAITIMLLYPEKTLDNVTSLIRENRGRWALSNHDFVEYLELVESVRDAKISKLVK